jgi:hypothetical protein
MAFGPDKKAIVGAQTLGFAEIDFAFDVQAGDDINAPPRQIGQGGH